MESTVTTEANTNKCWYNSAGLLHRTDGPAVEHADGNMGWCLNGEPLGWHAKGFWAFWDRLSTQQRADLNIQLWAAKYVGGN